MPGPRTAKHRLHLDLFVQDEGEAIAELEQLGATVLHRDLDQGHLGFSATTLADPEGGEFCVVCRRS